MNMIEAMTGAANAQDEVVEQPYEKSGAFIGGLAGVVAGGVAGLVLGGITGAVTGGGGALSGALRGAMTGVLSGVALGGISGAQYRADAKEYPRDGRVFPENLQDDARCLREGGSQSSPARAEVD